MVTWISTSLIRRCTDIYCDQQTIYFGPPSFTITRQRLCILNSLEFLFLFYEKPMLYISTRSNNTFIGLGSAWRRRFWCIPCFAIAFYHRPNQPPKRLPPAPPAPPLPASISNHCLRNFLSFICSGFVSFVSSCASCLLNARRVGIELIYTKNQPCPIQHVFQKAPEIWCHYHIFHTQVGNKYGIQLYLRVSNSAFCFSNPFIFY